MNERPTVGLEPIVFSRTRLGGDFALFAAEDWQTCTTDPAWAYRAFTAPGCTPLIALDGDAWRGLTPTRTSTRSGDVGQAPALREAPDDCYLALGADMIPGFRLREERIACAR